MSTPEGSNVPEQAPAAASLITAKKSRTGLWIGIGIAVLVVIAIVIAAVSGAFGGANTATSASPTAEVSASASSSASPTGSASPSVTPTEPVRVAVPADCTAAFSSELQQKFAASGEGIPLNDPDTAGGGTEDAELATLLDRLRPNLECRWGTPGDSGASTSFAAVNETQAGIVNANMKARGAECTEAQGGTLCIIPLATDEENPWGGEGAGIRESSFIREGLWISAKQINFMGNEYLQDSISTVFGS
ncbi:hypothetical protein [Mycetocola saprophilus]|uniref:hypothetical protein n=1 Tax=Mycetocola saprophilus TaxID=76636 RepID=UPI003BF3C52E